MSEKNDVSLISKLLGSDSNFNVIANLIVRNKL